MNDSFHFLIAVVTDTRNHSYDETYSRIQIQFSPGHKGSDFEKQKPILSEMSGWSRNYVEFFERIMSDVMEKEGSV